jgi:hypothetical protein
MSRVIKDSRVGGGGPIEIPKEAVKEGIVVVAEALKGVCEVVDGSSLTGGEG